ncbi:hypothetical protein BBAD15_g10212 [Beauveria bassiana D1-5]|uniref:NADH-ubiquinone oxidoreductase B12 subunit n=1 Tax=Beauveria bassiana D1-5 TaxID=1245745 RepID=A0A0A2VUU1_BEABA|nr:hypothetical protein BBAD15_g10212 [Beauveria bassiana D1-5]
MLPTRCDQHVLILDWRRCASTVIAAPHRLPDRTKSGGKANITGFSMRAFKEAAGKARYDPWERAYVTDPQRTSVSERTKTRVSQWNEQVANMIGFATDSDAWRFQGPFTRFNRFRGTLPGLGTATVLFAGYCTYEHFFMQDEHHHGDEAHH